LLEEYVANYPGTLLLVSHDRAFLDHVVTSLLVFEGAGVVRDFVGGYSDWIRYREERSATAAPKPAARAPADTTVAARNSRPSRLSYQAQRELSALPDRLQALEAEKAQIESQLADGSLYRAAQPTLQERLQRLASIETEIESGYARWAELESMTAGSR
jgi:ATP-binding cassette subfamily F protein uup